jgi:hypothetical protein
MVKVFLLIVVGLAGDPTHSELFLKWGSQLAVSADKLGVSSERLIYLADQPEGGEKDKDNKVTGPATQEAVVKAFDSLAAQVGPDDVVLVTLIGHGDYNGKEAKFNLRGPDMTAAAFKPLLAKLKSQRIVFVNTTSASGPFMAELSGPGRTIVTATRNGAETYDTLFAGHFVDAVTSEDADLDKNRRITVYEAFQYATAQVARSYEREGLLMTEHAMLDDDGDKEGTQKLSATTKDGRMASVLTIGSIDSGAAIADPKIAALYGERREMERRIENLRLLKPNMDPAKYNAELESLGVAIARKTKEIRAAEAAVKKQ